MPWHHLFPQDIDLIYRNVLAVIRYQKLNMSKVLSRKKRQYKSEYSSKLVCKLLLKFHFSVEHNWVTMRENVQVCFKFGNGLL